MKRSCTHRIFSLALFASLLAGCVPVTRSGAGPLLVPPTPASQAATATLPATPPTADATPAPDAAATNTDCQDNLVFRSDVTIPDGTSIQADSTLDKRWEVENTGSCNWQQDYRVRLIAGPELGAQPEQALYPARSGTRAVIRIVFKAPTEPGNYRSAWQAFNPQGEPFGDPFFIDIVVE